MTQDCNRFIRLQFPNFKEGKYFGWLGFNGLTLVSYPISNHIYTYIQIYIYIYNLCVCVCVCVYLYKQNLGDCSGEGKYITRQINFKRNTLELDQATSYDCNLTVCEVYVSVRHASTNNVIF